MNFDNPDKRKYAAVTVAVIMFSIWIGAIWTESEKLGWSGALLIPPLIALAIWTGVGYDNESVLEADERKERKKNKSRLDNSARL